MIYDVNYFIDHFSRIPESQWCINSVMGPKGAKCANGHCGMTDYHDYTEMSQSLARLFTDVVVHNVHNGTLMYESPTEYYYGGFSMIAAWINDGGVKEYQQATPKERILAALKDIQAMELAKDKPKEKVKHIYHSVEVSDKVKKFLSEIIEN